MLFRDLLHERAVNFWVRYFRVGRVGKALVPIDDDLRLLLDFSLRYDEARTWFADRRIRREIFGPRSLTLPLFILGAKENRDKQGGKDDKSARLHGNVLRRFYVVE